jgi:cell division septation protein DedD
MDRHIPLEQRQQAAALAVQLRNEADAARTRALAASELEAREPVIPAERVPRPAATVALSPSIAAARAAVAEASRATGTESPAEAGASFARPSRAQVAAAAPVATPASRPARVPAASSATGPWRVQLGAFSVRGNAEALWSRLRGRSELAGRQRLMVAAGPITKLQAAGYASRAAAHAACRSLKQSGHDCLVTNG